MNSSKLRRPNREELKLAELHREILEAHWGEWDGATNYSAPDEKNCGAVSDDGYSHIQDPPSDTPWGPLVHPEKRKQGNKRGPSFGDKTQVPQF